MLLDSYKPNPAKVATLSLTLLMGVPARKKVWISCQCAPFTQWSGMAQSVWVSSSHKEINILTCPSAKSLLVQRWEQGTMMDEKARHAQFSQHPPCCARPAPSAAGSSWDQCQHQLCSHTLSFPGCHTCTFPQTLPSFPVLNKGLGRKGLSPAIHSAVHHLKLIIPHQLLRPDARHSGANPLPRNHRWSSLSALKCIFTGFLSTHQTWVQQKEIFSAPCIVFSHITEGWCVLRRQGEVNESWQGSRQKETLPENLKGTLSEGEWGYGHTFSSCWVMISSCHWQ